MTTRGTAAKTAADTASDVAHESASVAKEANARMGEVINDSQKTVTEGIEKFSKGVEGMASFNQDNMEAFVKSSEIASKAFEGISTEISSFSKKSFEDGVSAAQDIAGTRTVTELFEKQTAYAQSALEGWLHQATKMNEIYVAAAKDISAPLGARMSAATDAMKRFSL